jgi:molybdopterin synthase catalytic subunit
MSMGNTRIRVGTETFSIGDEYHWLSQCDDDGAVVTFTGKVRNHNLGDSVSVLTLEHYPGMTEKAMVEIIDEARRRCPGDEIVFVGVTSAHRSMAFDAAEFMMDHLKTKVPFWKREATMDGERWVESRDSDHQAVRRW